MKSLDLDSSFQVKVSSNGLDDNVDYSQEQSAIPLKARIEPQCQKTLRSLKSNKRLFSIFQQMMHYHDILYASGEEISKQDDHNRLMIESLCIHILNHVMKAFLFFFFH